METQGSTGLYPDWWPGLPEESGCAGGWDAVSAEWEVRGGTQKAVAQLSKINHLSLLLSRHMNCLSYSPNSDYIIKQDRDNIAVCIS